jgi:hypothetical protein
MVEADPSLSLSSNHLHVVAGSWTGTARPPRILAMASAFPPFEYPQSHVCQLPFIILPPSVCPASLIIGY